MGNFFGYMRFTTGTDSLPKQVKLLSQGNHIHLNIIRVGIDQYVNSDFIEIEAGIWKMHSVYAQVGIAVGRIEYYYITTQDAPGSMRTYPNATIVLDPHMEKK